MVNPTKVAELFIAAGAAITRLGQLTHMLPSESRPEAETRGKWTDVEVELLASAISSFSLQLHAITSIIESRVNKQMEDGLTKAMYKHENLPCTSTSASAESTSFRVRSNVIEDIVDQNEEVVTNDVNLFMSTPDHELNVIQFDEKEKSNRI